MKCEYCEDEAGPTPINVIVHQNNHILKLLDYIASKV